MDESEILRAKIPNKAHTVCSRLARGLSRLRVLQ
jgi:hypothetical protein